jgi:transcriptional regulator with PAS, ATPase and Fis domain
MARIGQGQLEGGPGAKHLDMLDWENAPSGRAARSTARRDADGFESELVLGQRLEKVRGLIELAARSRCPVLITGETGVGKNRIARAIHDAGASYDEPFITINCAALPEHLVESELFGYEKGAFTGATAGRKGMFELAEGGTLLLDELGDVPSYIQMKLLGVLDDGLVRRLGSETERQIDTRVVASTSADLANRLGVSFRTDLYYRLSVIHIELPPLRERRDDIPAISRSLVRRLNRGVDAPLSSSELEALCSYDWPGNIRELRNVLERALIIARGDDLHPSRILGTPQLPDPAAPSTRPIESLESLERDHIRRALAHFEGNLTRTARALGLSISTLKRKRKTYQLG